MTTTTVLNVGARPFSLRMPTRRTKTARKALAHKARLRLASYRRVAGDDPSAGAVLDLLWTIALAEQALAAETGGLLGDKAATPSKVTNRLRNA